MKRLALALLLSSSTALAQEPAPARGPGPDPTIAAGAAPRLSLRGAVARALEVSPDVAVARAQIDEATAAHDEAWSRALPRVQLTARYTYLGLQDNDPLITPPGDLPALRQRAEEVVDPAARDVLVAQVEGLQSLASSRVEIPRHQLTFEGTVTYPIAQLFTEILPAIEASSRGEEARRVELEVAQADVAVQAVEWLMQHARARAALTVAERALARAEADLEAAERRLEAELGTVPDVLRFRARVAGARREQASREADVAGTAAALRALLDLEGRGPLAVSEDLTALPPLRPMPPAERLLARAEAQRPELRALDLWAAASDEAAKATSGGMWPQLNAQLAGQVGRPNNLYVPPGDRFRPSWSASLVLSWSPDAAYTASTTARRRRADALRIRRQAEALRDGVRIEVEQSVASYRAARAAHRASREEVTAAEEAYAARRRAFEVGATDVTELLAAELDSHRAQLALIDAGAELRVRRAQLQRAVGDPIE